MQLLFQLKLLSSKGNATLSVDDVREFQKRLYEGRDAKEDRAEHIDYMKVLEKVLSKKMPAERYIGIMNLCYIFFYPDAKQQEIESALVNMCELQTVFSTKIQFNFKG